MPSHPTPYRRYVIEELDGGDQAYDGEEDVAQSEDRDDAIRKMTDSEYVYE
jgi:hypothetical protein